MSLPSAPAPVDPKLHAQMNGHTAATCVDGLITYPTADGPEHYACHGCAACQPHTSQVIGPRRDRTAAAVAAVFAATTDDAAW